MRTVLLFLLGASMGSFLGLVIDRVPHQSILFPASHCNHCKKKLKPIDLIPIFSQIYRKSRCGYCQAKIPLWYAFFESICGGLLLMVDANVLSISTYLILLCGLTLAVYDLKHKEYPVLVWFGFLCLLLLINGFSALFFVFMTLALLAELLPLKIGAGDFLYLALIALVHNLTDILWIIQISSYLGIAYILLMKSKKTSIPFIPFLFLAILLYFRFTHFPL